MTPLPCFNPAFTRILQAHGQLAQHPQVVVVADEVYENLVFDGLVHTRFATLPGMFDRTITVSRYRDVLSFCLSLFFTPRCISLLSPSPVCLSL